MTTNEDRAREWLLLHTVGGMSPHDSLVHALTRLITEAEERGRVEGVAWRGVASSFRDALREDAEAEDLVAAHDAFNHAASTYGHPDYYTPAAKPAGGEREGDGPWIRAGCLDCDRDHGPCADHDAKPAGGEAVAVPLGPPLEFRAAPGMFAVLDDAQESALIDEVNAMGKHVTLRAAAQDAYDAWASGLTEELRTAMAVLCDVIDGAHVPEPRPSPDSATQEPPARAVKVELDAAVSIIRRVRSLLDRASMLDREQILDALMTVVDSTEIGAIGYVPPRPSPAPADASRLAQLEAVAALRLAARWLGDHRDPSGTFEDIGEWFYRETGFLRPGKDESARSGGRDGDRRAAWDAWCERTRDRVVDACKAALAAEEGEP